MSFILEALKKSDAERRRNQAPDLDALHALAASTKSFRRQWLWLLLFILLLNTVFIVWWLRPWSSAENRSTSEDAPVIETQPISPAVSTSKPSPASREKHILPPHQQAAPGWNDLPDKNTLPSRLPETYAVPRKERIPFLHELPADLRRQVPELAITLHYYTSDPDSRLARVNGAVLREGEAVNDRVTLEKITAEAVLFRFGETLFRLGEY